MAKIKTLEDGNRKLHVFYCPACRRNHCFDERWTYNDDENNPTFSPSLVTGGTKQNCHSFVRDGQIQFLGDCYHEKAGQTVEIPDWKESNL